MIIIYLGILTIGIAAIVFILRKESKGSKPSPVDLLNSLEVDENPSEERKAPHKIPSSNFFNRLNLNNEKPKQAEKIDEPISHEKLLSPPIPKDNDQKETPG